MSRQNTAMGRMRQERGNRSMASNLKAVKLDEIESAPRVATTTGAHGTRLQGVAMHDQPKAPVPPEHDHGGQHLVDIAENGAASICRFQAESEIGSR